MVTFCQGWEMQEIGCLVRSKEIFNSKHPSREGCPEGGMGYPQTPLEAWRYLVPLTKGNRKGGVIDQWRYQPQTPPLVPLNKGNRIRGSLSPG